MSKKYTEKTFWVHIQRDEDGGLSDRIRFIGKDDPYNTEKGFFNWIVDMREDSDGIVVNCGVVD